MAPITITVTGNSSIDARPEQAVLSLQVKSDGPSKDIVSKEATATANQVQQTFKELQAESSPPVSAFSTQSVRSGSEVPRDNDGNPRERVYFSQISFEATFHDFERLGQVTGRLSAHPNIEICNVDWRLTDATKKDLSSRARKQAMVDAIQKAKDYADVIGREVVPVEITDTDCSYGYPPRMMANCMAAPGLGAEDEREDLDLTPRNIDVTNSVQVNFKGE
ncbi:hypothetical protein ASPWEDRAFT_36383 [Aspergillus wentii DTO 134E9]|uniref:SIMPL domain-containing protein n=1 Tax=Aspergillus wentii DTO 134E9 TaxID=1073089 RepID=A0A1L9RV14_ASPWE|nr:uncharacterized protein ASPWEDRAFT_36383 [Aspergillus wentii DTO 134E9]OJJ38707.1 hypothetical protein ASPWEDRAFT_36383 [Aspergillus wentii DTO 134E9]